MGIHCFIKDFNSCCSFPVFKMHTNWYMNCSASKTINPMITTLSTLLTVSVITNGITITDSTIKMPHVDIVFTLMLILNISPFAYRIYFKF